jgi:putative oxidoreductase
MSSFLNSKYVAPVDKIVNRLIAFMSSIPLSFTSALARFSIAAVFWKSGQTKIEGFVIDIVAGDFQFGWPSLSDTAVFLFEEEYNLPLLSPEFGAYTAAAAEHIFPALILVGLATRFSALALLIMTLVIQVLVYPGAYPTHGVWAAVLLFIMAYGPGKLSLDELVVRKLRPSS